MWRAPPRGAGDSSWRRAVLSRTSSASSEPRCSTSTGPGRRTVCDADLHAALGGAVDEAGAAARNVPTSGPGTSARPSSSKTTTASASPRPVPAGSGRVSAKTPVSPRACQSGALMACSSPSRPAGARAGGDRPASSGCPRRAPVGPRRRGSPSAGLGQAEDPLGHDVALHLRGAGRDGQRDRLEPGVQLLGVAERRPRRARRAGRRTAPPGRAPRRRGRRAPARARRRTA